MWGNAISFMCVVYHKDNYDRILILYCWYIKIELQNGITNNRGWRTLFYQILGIALLVEAK